MGHTHDQRTMTPPTLPTPAPQPRLRGPSQWPTVIGVLAIIFGALEVLGGCVGIVSPWVMSAMVEVLPEGQSMGMAAMVEWGRWMVASSLAGLGIGVLLLLGGVSLMQRRPRGRTLCLTWALLRMPAVVLGLVVGYLMQRDQLVAMQEMFASDPSVPAAMSAMFGRFMQAGVLVGSVIGLLWGWALPVFMLIWFSRGKIKTEVASWSGGPAAAASDPLSRYAGEG